MQTTCICRLGLCTVVLDLPQEVLYGIKASDTAECQHGKKILSKVVPRADHRDWVDERLSSIMAINAFVH